MRIYDDGVKINIEDVDFGKIYDFTISNDKIEFNMSLNSFLNLGEGLLDDYLLSSGSDDDFFISITIDYFNSEGNNNSEKLKENIFRENSAHKLLKTQDITDGTYKLKDFEVNSTIDNSYVSFWFEVEDEKGSDDYVL